jgi:subtilisin family serine protease
MTVSKVPAGHVRALVERPRDDAFLAAANDLLRGRDPTQSMLPYARNETGKIPIGLRIDPSFGAIPIGRGTQYERPESLQAYLDPKNSDRFLVSGYVDVSGGDGVPENFIENEQKYPIYSNPLIGGLQKPSPWVPTCVTSQCVGNTKHVRQKLHVQTLQDNGLDGSGVAIAIVDSGIYLQRITRLLGEALKSPATVNLDNIHSWRPSGVVTQPGKHRVGHGTMCAYDALIAAPNATLLDFPMLLARPVADHHSTSMADAAIHAYYRLAALWVSKAFDALIVSNSWGLFHPCLEDFPPGHNNRFIDNPDHPFHRLVQALARAGVDIIFCGNNCGNDRNCAGDCASGPCLSKTDRMIMGANAYEEVLTVGGCDTNDRIVGYSSRGPSIAGMYQKKPDLVSYTHFLGSKIVSTFAPDTGVSAACPVAAGCVAALRTKVKATAVMPSELFNKLRDTAYRPSSGSPGWKPDFGYGIINPVAAGRELGVLP